MNFDPPTGICRTIAGPGLPSKPMKLAVTAASALPRFWMMNGVT